MMCEAVPLRLDEADGFLGDVEGSIGEAVSGDAHITVSFVGVEIESWIES